ncbi:aspartate dehydrogenase [Paraburkholderia caribensis MBA4]|uniref:Aspartate dehydrogenase n=1 Tax=Paraburkholderia caribensis MBA4 TaxID=1323664 RepID=A0A0P0RJY5_9BURK|nr:aspartate dehydrogenase [Paraburkholderia caribensis MBA4]
MFVESGLRVACKADSCDGHYCNSYANHSTNLQRTRKTLCGKACAGGATRRREYRSRRMTQCTWRTSRLSPHSSRGDVTRMHCGIERSASHGCLTHG